MRTSASSAFRNSTRRRSQVWLDFLTTTNNEPRNHDVLTHYFFDRGTEFPSEFYRFIRSFKRFLQTHATSQKLATRYLQILSPICERFGFFEEKKNLDDFCFHVTDPSKYREIDLLLVCYKRTSRNVTSSIMKTFQDYLYAKGIRCEITGRYKNIYSIFRKLQKKSDDSALQLNDIFAFRIIPFKHSARECFEILNLLHDRFSPIADFFKDYINIPKINGYQSLHTGLRDIHPGFDLPVEVQIRTKAMNEFAELGLASHWLYAEEKKSKLLTEKEKRLLDYFSSLSHTSEKQKWVYCLSYTGDLFRLENGATILDFAYHIHTEVGQKAQFALVNKKKKPLSYTLQEGDRIEIRTGPSPQIESAWLDYAQTSHARRKIAEYLKT